MAARSATIPYSPAPPPIGTDRAIWDEFYKLQEALINLDRPASLTGSSPEPVPVTASVSYDRLFDEADAISYEQPTGQFDTTTGIWTCPQEGLYLLLPLIQVPAFTTPASKLFTATLRTTFTYAAGGTKVVTSSAGGDDRVPLRLQPVFLEPLLKGDTVFFDLDLTHETKTGTVNVISVINIVRQSSIR